MLADTAPLPPVECQDARLQGGGAPRSRAAGGLLHEAGYRGRAPAAGRHREGHQDLQVPAVPGTARHPGVLRAHPDGREQVRAHQDVGGFANGQQVRGF